MRDIEIFKKVKDHLLTQGVRSATVRENAPKSLSSTVVCRYRGPDGLKCAVGCLIDDKSYSERLEGFYAGHRPVLEAVRRSLDVEELPEETVRMIVELQKVHDEHAPPIWPRLLEELGSKFSEDGGYLG